MPATKPKPKKPRKPRQPAAPEGFSIANPGEPSDAEIDHLAAILEEAGERDLEVKRKAKPARAR